MNVKVSIIPFVVFSALLACCDAFLNINRRQIPQAAFKLSRKMHRETLSPPPFKIFCDLDGVLVDFGEGVRRLCGVRPEQLTKRRMWSIISREKGFYEKLPWMKGGPELWEAIKPLQPDILTGVPMYSSASTEKANWCRRELGIPTNHVNMAGPRSSHVVVSGQRRKNVTNVITCWSSNKFHEAGQRAVLIDDRLDLGRMWENQGGIFIHHTPGDVAPTLAKLEEYGILPTTTEAQLGQEMR
jgi:hypothetical protein